MLPTVNSEINKYATAKRLELDEDNHWLRGVVRDEKGGLFKYYLEIDVRPWPRLFPQVWETDNLISWNVDNHVYSNNGMLCLDTFSRQSYLINTGQVTSLIQWHEEVLLPHLARQYDYHNGDIKAFENSGFSHGKDGLIEAFQTILETKTIESTLKVLFFIYHKQRFFSINKKKRQAKCPCKSGKMITVCNHKKSILYRTIDSKALIRDLKQIFDT